MGIPAGSLLGALVGPLQTLVLLVVLLTTPILLAAAVVAGWLKAMLPADFRVPDLTLFNIPRGEPPDLLLIILGVIVGSIFLFEFVALIVLLWMVYGGRRGAALDQPFEERAIVPPLSR